MNENDEKKKKTQLKNQIDIFQITGKALDEKQAKKKHQQWNELNSSFPLVKHNYDDSFSGVD